MHGGFRTSTLAIAFACFVPAPETSLPFQVWVLSSLERAVPADRAGTKTSARIFAARGEFEAFQVVVKAPKEGLADVAVAASNFVGSNDRTIGNQHIALYREIYVYVNEASPDWKGQNRSLGSGWYPDALIPYADQARGNPPAAANYRAIPFDVPSGLNQPVWVDVFVPREGSAGDYRGAIVVTSTRGVIEVPVTLTVWDFELPLKPSLRSSFGYSQPHRQTIEELLKHKVMPQRAGPALCAGTCASLSRVEADLIDRFGLASTDLGFWSGADRNTCVIRSSPPPVQFLTAALKHHPDLYLFNYTADEIDDCPNLHTSIKEWARNMHHAEIRNLVVMAPVPELFDDGSGSGRSAVDIWVVLPNTYDAALPYVKRVLKRGDEVWSYNTLVQDSYSPKWLIDYDPINFRVQPGFLSQSLKLTGLLYWRSDHWPTDPWVDVNNQGAFGPGNYPGEGMLVYPGAPAGLPGVAPSIRLKQLREGIEDYEYIELLKQLGRGEWALNMARRVGPDWANWSRDKNFLESTRRRLGEEIHRIARNTST